jgi:galactofuranosylgalactofuranosylrhamnosyl-N-acetylglucosaminyl-diphospho-decaprenol beta-1,5/1,6-galactofuranosyltransferase
VLAADWDDLAQRYREAMPHITSPEAWEETFRPWLDGGPDEQ